MYTLYRIRYSPLHPLYGALPCAVSAGAGDTRRSDRTSVYLCAIYQDFYYLKVYLWNDLSDPIFDGVGLAGFKSMANAFVLA